MKKYYLFPLDMFCLRLIIDLSILFVTAWGFTSGLVGLMVKPHFFPAVAVLGLLAIEFYGGLGNLYGRMA
jgi:hypothetical protein